MKPYIVFDCYETLIYKKDLEKIVFNFANKIIHKKIGKEHINRAYDLIYYRHKFNHPRFKNEKDRQDFYIKYNQELFNILGFEITNKQALKLNNQLKKTSYACYKDTLPALNFLKKKQIPLGLISNWTFTLKNILISLKLDKYFNFIHSSHDLKVDKPNPKIFNKVLKDTKKEYNKIYYVGNDYTIDVVPARSVGLVPILIDRDNIYPDKIDCIKIKSLEELKNIL